MLGETRYRYYFDDFHSMLLQDLHLAAYFLVIFRAGQRAFAGCPAPHRLIGTTRCIGLTPRPKASQKRLFLKNTFIGLINLE